jgi:predicted nucleic acid-binding protein
VKTTADTSVIVAAFASWHEHHSTAFAAVGRVDTVVAHCLLETYSVLTRLPAPHRMTPVIVSKYLSLAFGRHTVCALSAAEQRKLVGTCAAQGLAGGAVYDAVIAATCAAAGIKLLTLDGRARQTYAVLGVDHELLA